jgi:hypothetical protein
MRSSIVWLTLGIVGVTVPTSPSRAADIDFGRDVLPILSDFCFQCHGPDEKARKAKLRLDDKQSIADRGIIVPGKPAESELIDRITSTDDTTVMPPPSLKRKLSPQQIDTLTKWVEQGAKWGRHWSFEPMAKPVVPQIRNPKYEIRNPIDNFVLARLEKEGLVPSPPADKERLIRRVTFDLTGLPPTPREIDDFLKDQSPNAYEKVIDRLLASPRFGERMAAEWLDVARYADTHGYQMDRFRPVWPYRDWVIAAFNRNLPFDQFVTWQLAGDLLPNATKEQRLATAFNRLHMQNEEGGVVEEEFRVAYVNDRVTTFGTAFLGMTLECSRCHDHKYDPISMKDFYSLFAFFQNIDESGQTSYFTAAMPVPTLLLSTDEQDKTIADVRRKIADQEESIRTLRAELRPHFDRWLANRGDVPKLGSDAHFPLDGFANGTVPNAADPKKPGRVHEQPKSIPGKIGMAAELDGENGFTFPGLWHFHRADSFSLGLWVRPPARHAERAVVVHHSKAPIDAGSRGYELLLEGGRPAFGLHHMWPGNSVKVRAKAPIPAGQWSHITVTYDGSSRAAGVRLYVNGQPVEVEVIRDKLTKDILYGGGEPDVAIGYRFRDNGFKGGAVDEFQLFRRCLTPLEVAAIAGLPDLTDAWQTPAEKLTPTQREGLFEWWFTQESRTAIGARLGLAKLRDEERRLVEPIPEIMVMEELPQPKPAFVLKRGAYDAPGERVTADTPKAMPPFPADAPRNRLGLAKWLTDPEHPLLARVTVNRAWQMMFGRGLVETADNFGTQGSRPTHPELLDWLAREFVAPSVSGGSQPAVPWDYKRLLKLIAMSATYRQSSKASPELLQRDPENLLLARGPARRLTAEMLRDQALAVSGLLVEKLGGPSVKPYQPPGLWEEIAMGRPRYDQGKGDDLYRRSLYTFWKRTVPPPSMMTLDAADRSVCIVKRQATTTPLSALVLLNDVQFVEAARFLGQRMLQEGGTTPAEQVTFGFRLVTGRHPNEKERAVLVKFFAEQKAAFEADPAAAKKLLSVGEKPADASLPVADLAAAAAVGNLLLNLDEATTRR